MRECLPGTIPNETNATCSDCAMCPPKGHTPEADDPVFYNPDTKCCSYLPMMWNFLTGAVLQDDSPEAARGRRTVEERIAAGIAVSPIGLERTPVFHLLYSRIPEAFGRTRTLRCPHYIEEGGLCGVWRSRESTCATWFCKHERGVVSKQFWRQLHRLLTIAERQLAAWVMVQLDIGVEALKANFPFPEKENFPVTGADFDGKPDPAVQRLRWGNWYGREHEFYRRASDLVRPLSWDKVRAIGNAELQVAERIVQRAFADLNDTAVPAKLWGTEFSQRVGPDGVTLVTGYSGLDPLQLSREVMSILPYFHGQTVRAARQQILRELGLEVELDLLRKLADFGVLTDSPG
jgi:hypothetical protein